MSVRFIWKKSCDTCRKYKKQLDAWGVVYEGREINAEPLGAEELEALIGHRKVKPFLNTRNVVYRERGLSKATPDKAGAVTLIAAHNNLLKRPILMVGEEMVIGNDLVAAGRLLGVGAGSERAGRRLD
jgi:arsenate reductase-like glutaredoxin family protein